MIELKAFLGREGRAIALLLLIFVLPLFNRFPNIALALILLLSIIEVCIRKEIPKLRMHWFLPALFVYYIVSELLSGGAWATMERRFLLVGMPIAFALNPDFYSVQLRPRIYLSYILGNLLAIFVCFVRAIVRSVEVNNGQWLFNPKVIKDTEYDFLTSSVMGGNYFFSDEFSWFHNPNYFGVYIVVALYLIFEISRLKRDNVSVQFLIGCYAIFLVALFLLSGKAAIFSAVIVSFWIGFKMQIPKIVRISIVSLILMVTAAFLIYNPKLKIFINTIRTENLINPSARYGHDLRILSWDASLSVIKDNWLIGVGEANKRAALVEVYRQKGYIVPGEQEHNSHNQYLDLLVGGGVIGFGLFMTGWCQLIIRSIRRRNAVLSVFLLIFSFNFLFECLLSRYAGVLLFSVFISLLSARSSEEAGTVQLNKAPLP